MLAKKREQSSLIKEQKKAIMISLKYVVYLVPGHEVR